MANGRGKMANLEPLKRTVPRQSPVQLGPWRDKAAYPKYCFYAHRPCGAHFPRKLAWIKIAISDRISRRKVGSWLP
jgi:hypothetical protein